MRSQLLVVRDDIVTSDGFSRGRQFRGIGKMFLAMFVSLFVLLFVSGRSMAASALREADFGNRDGKVTEFNEHYRLFKREGQMFNMPYQGQAAEPTVSDKAAKIGGRSLKLTIGPSAPGQTTNDRSEFTLVHQGDPLSLRLGQERYMGFSIFFDKKAFPPPRGEIIVSQIWQPFKEEKAGPVAFIVMVPGKDDLSFTLATRDDTSEKSTQVDLGHPRFVENQWNSVVLHVLPRAVNDPNGPGLIEMWLNGKYLGGSRRYWGHASPNFLDTFDARVGLYGNPQPVAHTIWIDQLRWGASKEAVTSN
ncbi:heparin lyase I family protein [Burkholderia sp. IMCC1007]|uniref:heparin lyase I family protein n=1 Tax=Burkholderia sp. IMCC1007 TaxID=3004104 RepID=UPI0022B34BDA|nr:heparin lyase I family protein [Burkholderia sp. IMCC1007]